MKIIYLPIIICAFFVGSLAPWECLWAKDKEAEKVTILCLGDSLTAGYGVEAEESWTWLLQKRLEKDFPQKTFDVINGGESGATTASALPRLKWFMQKKLDIIILALGANDGLRVVDLNQSKQNLSQTIELARNKGIEVLLVGMKMPPNLGREFQEKFASIYRELAREWKVPSVPFLLEGVGGVKELNLSDGIHPNAQGQIKMLDNVYAVLRPMLQARKGMR